MKGLWPIRACIVAYALGQTALCGDIAGTIVLQNSAGVIVTRPAMYDLRGSTTQTAAPVRTHGRFDHVAVWLESEKRQRPIAAVNAEMKQIGRHFEPDFLLVAVGSTVQFPNGDPIFHNIFSLSRAQSFDLGYYPQGKTRDVTFRRAGMIQVYCHIHSDMYGVIVVAPTGWSAIPDSGGFFSFKDLPGGDYRLGAWQRKAGLVHKKISIPDQGSVHLAITLPDESDD